MAPQILIDGIQPDYSWRTHELIGHGVAEELRVVGFMPNEPHPQRQKATR